LPPERSNSQAILTRSLVPSLPVRVIDGSGHERDGCDLSDLCVCELTQLADALHDSFDPRLVIL
jgi:hypothetical protein